jgi:hypothetical protein
MAENKARIRKEIKDALEGALNDAFHGHVPDQERVVDNLVEVVVAECTELRERIADRIIGPLVGRYEDGLNNDRLEILAHVVRSHYETNTGEIELLDPPQPSGLLRIQ